MPAPTYQEFCEDYCNYYFDGSAPEKGRGFIIEHNGNVAGFISYASFHLKPSKAELDIWMNSLVNCGKGFGTDAIIALGDYLNETLGVNQLIMRPSAKNKNAIKSYKKAGLEESGAQPQDYMLEECLDMYGDGDYGEDETALLIKNF